MAQIWGPLQVATVAQVSTQQEQLWWNWGRAAYVSELHYQLLSTHEALGDLEKGKDLAEDRQNDCLRTYVETKLNPFQAFGFIKAETNNSPFKTDLLLWLTSCCTEPAWSSNIRYFLSRQPTLFFKYMDGLKSLLTQWTSNIHLEFSPWNRQLLRSKCAQSNNCQPFRHFT